MTDIKVQVPVNSTSREIWLTLRFNRCDAAQHTCSSVLDIRLTWCSETKRRSLAGANLMVRFDDKWHDKGITLHEYGCQPSSSWSQVSIQIRNPHNLIFQLHGCDAESLRATVPHES